MGVADYAADEAAVALRCMRAVCAAMIEHEAELSGLDRAIGDGDHGSNVARAARALLDQADELACLPVGQGIERAGYTIVMTVGGASGPLYGSLLMAMGKVWPEPAALPGIAAAFAEGVAAVAKRGRSAAGEKTMLDVLLPASRALQESDARTALTTMVDAADAGLEATRPLVASKGRAAFVGERSVGHLDPGAASARLALHAVAKELSGEAV